MRSIDQDLDKLSWLGGYSDAQLKTAQREDKNLKPVINALENRLKPKDSVKAKWNEESRILASRWNQLVLRDGILYRRWTPSSNEGPVTQLVLPAQLRAEILHQLHDLRVVGHLGVQRTLARVQHRYYWPGCALDVARWCASCPQCAGRKGKPGPARHPMTSLPVGAPFDRVAMDILDTHKVTPRGYRYVLVISDYFTKWTDAFPLRRHTAGEVAKVFVSRFVVYYGVPKQIHSDQGTEFESKLFRSLAELLGSAKIRTVPYRPQSDGQVERFNRSLIAMLSAFVCERANDWDDHLPYVMMAYRSSVHASTNCTPYRMLYGREQNLPVDIMYPTGQDTNVPQCGPEYSEWVRRAISSAHDFARAHLDKSAIRQKRGYDANAKHRPPFKRGDKVRYYYPPLKQGNKFAKPWVGPFTVVRKVTDVDYRIRQDSNPQRILVTHIDNLKPFEGDYIDAQRYTHPSQNVPDPADLPVNDPDILDGEILMRLLGNDQTQIPDTSPVTSEDEDEDLGNVMDTDDLSRSMNDGASRHESIIIPDAIQDDTNLPNIATRPRRSKQGKRPAYYGFG